MGDQPPASIPNHVVGGVVADRLAGRRFCGAPTEALLVNGRRGTVHGRQPVGERPTKRRRLPLQAVDACGNGRTVVRPAVAFGGAAEVGGGLKQRVEGQERRLARGPELDGGDGAGAQAAVQIVAAAGDEVEHEQRLTDDGADGPGQAGPAGVRHGAAHGPGAVQGEFGQHVVHGPPRFLGAGGLPPAPSTLPCSVPAFQARRPRRGQTTVTPKMPRCGRSPRGAP